MNPPGRARERTRSGDVPGRNRPDRLEGLRPSEAAALRHHHWRDEHGPLPYIDVEKAVKDIRGHLLEDERKTATLHEPILWPAIAEELEELYPP